jgi:hypothetical protein
MPYYFTGMLLLFLYMCTLDYDDSVLSTSSAPF